MVVIFLETAELRAKERKDLDLKFWQRNVDKILEFNEKPLLSGSGTISRAEMEEKVREIYNRFDSKRKKIEAQQADLADIDELKKLGEQLKRKK